MKQLGFTLMLFVVVLSPLAAVCQSEPQGVAVPPLETESASGGVPQQKQIPRGMRVQLRLTEALNTATHHKGDVVHLELASDLVAGGVVVLPGGTRATATITCSRRARGKKPGAIDFSDPELIVEGERIRLLPYNPGEVWEDGPGIVFGLAVAIPVVAAVGAAALPVAVVVHVVRAHRKKPPEHDVGVNAGMTFTYYTSEKTLVKIAGPEPQLP